MAWERKSQAKDEWKMEEIALRQELMEALRSNGVKVDTKRGKSKMQEELETFGGKDKDDNWVFMSKPTFNLWCKGKATKAVKKPYLRVIQDYIKKANEDNEEMDEDE